MWEGGFHEQNCTHLRYTKSNKRIQKLILCQSDSLRKNENLSSSCPCTTLLRMHNFLACSSLFNSLFCLEVVGEGGGGLGLNREFTEAHLFS